jgi:hypothetical protein
MLRGARLCGDSPNLLGSAKALAKLFQSRTEGDDVDFPETVSLVAAVKQQAARLRVVGTEQS